LRDIPTIELRDAIFESQLTQQKYGWGAPFLENHDLPRSLNKFFGEKANETNAKLLANVFFFLRGTPFIYQGQEIGMDNFVRNDISEFDDIASKDQYQRALGEGFSSEEALYFVNKRSRDNSRTPMQWGNSKNAGFSKIGEKVVQHQARKFGTSKFMGLNRFVNGYLDLLSLWFLNSFGLKPMHVFGFLGTVMFVFGFLATIVVGGVKLYHLFAGIPAPLVTNSPYFYISLTMMVLGTQLFVAGFLGELISRNAQGRNDYHIEEEF